MKMICLWVHCCSFSSLREQWRSFLVRFSSNLNYKISHLSSFLSPLHLQDELTQVVVLSTNEQTTIPKCLQVMALSVLSAPCFITATRVLSPFSRESEKFMKCLVLLRKEKVDDVGGKNLQPCITLNVFSNIFHVNVSKVNKLMVKLSNLNA